MELGRLGAVSTLGKRTRSIGAHATTSRICLLATVVAEVWRQRIPEGHALHVADDGIIWLYELPMGVHTFVDLSGLDGEATQALVAAADRLMEDALASHLAAVKNGVGA